MNGPDPALVAYVQRRLYRTRHRDAERHTLARREAARIRAAAYADALMGDGLYPSDYADGPLPGLAHDYGYPCHCRGCER